MTFPKRPSHPSLSVQVVVLLLPPGFLRILFEQLCAPSMFLGNQDVLFSLIILIRPGTYWQLLTCLWHPLVGACFSICKHVLSPFFSGLSSSSPPVSLHLVSAH